MEEGGVEEPYTEFRVEEDLVVGMVSLDITLEPLEFLVLLEWSFSAFEPVFRRRSSLKKGIIRVSIPLLAASFLRRSQGCPVSH